MRSFEVKLNTNRAPNSGSASQQYAGQTDSSQRLNESVNEDFNPKTLPSFGQTLEWRKVFRVDFSKAEEALYRKYASGLIAQSTNWRIKRLRYIAYIDLSQQLDSYLGHDCSSDTCHHFSLLRNADPVYIRNQWLLFNFLFNTTTCWFHSDTCRKMNLFFVCLKMPHWRFVKWLLDKQIKIINSLKNQYKHTSYPLPKRSLRPVSLTVGEIQWF